MKSEHKQTCPTCGQSVNKRSIQLYSGMVKVLLKIHKWCSEKETHEFTRKDIEHLLAGYSENCRMSDWVLFGGLMYRPDGEKKGGRYGMNMERTQDFLSGKLKIPTVILKDPLTKELEMTEYKNVYQIPHLAEFLDENKQYIARYSGAVEL